MTEELSEAPREAITWRKLSLQAVVGAAFGAGTMIAFLELGVEVHSALWSPSHILLAAVGLIYALMGMLLGVGTLAPQAIGRRLLNVSDAEELAEGRSMFLYSALGCITMGASLALLAFAASGDPRAPVGPDTAFWIFLAVFALWMVVSVIMWRGFDELWRQLTIDAYALTGQLLLVVLPLWGGAAAGGLVAGLQPLDLVSLAFGGTLLATFVAVGRRGMATPN